jgi:hypothetical protein
VEWPQFTKALLWSTVKRTIDFTRLSKDDDFFKERHVGMISQVKYFMGAMSTNDKAELVKQGFSESSTTKTLAAVLLKESNAGESSVMNTPITSNLTKVAEDAKVMTYAG